MSAFFSALIMTIPVLLFYSTRLEKSRIITISKPLVITQSRKTPAFFLYQRAYQTQHNKPETTMASTFLSTESLSLRTQSVVIAEMKLERQEIGSNNDFGFRIAASAKQPVNQDVESTIQVAMAEVSRPTIQLNSSPLKKWGTVRGKFEVKDGVGVVDHIVEIKRIEEGQVRELGRVDLQAGSYSIDIETPQGVLIAEIKDRSGLLIGEDRQRMINLQSNGTYFEGPFIRVGRPATIAANTAVPNSQDSGSGGYGRGIGRTGAGGKNPGVRHQEASAIVASLFSKQHQLETPKDQFRNVSKHSSTISIVEDQKDIHSKLITIRQTGDDNETPLFTKKWVAGALDFISDQMKIEFKSKAAPILIGRILHDGKAGQGFKVQIENQLGIAAIYLDQFMIPNTKLEETSENGYFMFVGLEPESYSVVSLRNNAVVGHQSFIAESGFVSYQHIVSATAPRSVLIRSFDAFTGEPQDMDLMLPNSEEFVETSGGLASYRTQNNLGVASYVVRPKQDYMPVNYVHDVRKDYLHIPLINENWLSKMQGQLQIDDLPNTGTIVGFVPVVDFEMYLISEAYNTKQIIYFNQSGEISSVPVAGGGFILFNVPAGAQEVIVQEKANDRIFSQVFFVKENQTTVAHFTE